MPSFVKLFLQDFVSMYTMTEHIQKTAIYCCSSIGIEEDEKNGGLLGTDHCLKSEVGTWLMSRAAHVTLLRDSSTNVNDRQLRPSVVQQRLLLFIVARRHH